MGSTLLESVAAANEKAKREHWASLRELLAAGDGNASDAKAALKHLDALRLDAASLPRLANAVAEHERLAVAAADADDPALAGQVEDASKAYRESVAETERIVAERKAIDAAAMATFTGLQGRRASAEHSRRRRTALERQFPNLFGCDPLPEPVWPSPSPTCFQIVPPLSEPTRMATRHEPGGAYSIVEVPAT